MPTEKKKKLRQIRLDELSLVDRGANQFSRIAITKRAGLSLDRSLFENDRQYRVAKAMLSDFKE